METDDPEQSRQKLIVAVFNSSADTVEMLRTVLDAEATNRRRLFELRDSAPYERAYADPDPLVSVVVATQGAGEPGAGCGHRNQSHRLR